MKDLLFLAFTILLVQVLVTYGKPITTQEQEIQSSYDRSNQQNLEPEEELEDLRALVGHNQPRVEIPVSGVKKVLAAPPAQLPRKVVVPRPVVAVENPPRQGQQAFRIAAAQAKAQETKPSVVQQQQPTVSSQKEAIEDYTELDANLDLTPKAVAEYLLITGDFEGFDNAIEDLLSAKIIKSEEAREYKDAVGWEYEGLLKRVVDAKQEYLKQFLESMDVSSEQQQAESNSPEPLKVVAEPATPNKRSPTLNGETNPENNVASENTAAMDAADLTMTLRKLQLKSLLEKEATLDELLQAIVEEYLLKGIEEGTKGNALPKADVKINPEERQIQQMIELMAQAVKQGSQTATTSTGAQLKKENLPVQVDSQEKTDNVSVKSVPSKSNQAIPPENQEVPKKNDETH